MASDSDSSEPGAANLEATAAVSDVRAGERSLGRGLADVSPLFRQRAAGIAAANEPKAPGVPEPSDVPAARHPGNVLLEPSTAAARAELIATLKASGGALEDNLRVIDAGIPCGPLGEIDLLALDGANQLAIIDVDCSGSDGLLLRGISHADWFVRNTAILRRMYHGLSIDGSRPPRLLLVAPRFSPTLAAAIRRFTGLQITCLRCLTVEVSGRTGVLFERVPGGQD